MPRVKLDKTKAYGWGVYRYMVGSLYRKEDGTLAVHVTRFGHAISWEDTERNAIAYAVKWSGRFWANLPYFIVPMATAHFGELRNKGFVGFAFKGKFHAFDKPLLAFDAMKAIENKLGNRIREAREMQAAC